MGLRAKFNLVLLAAFVIGLGLAAAVSYRIVRDNARREVLGEAAILMAAARSTADYTASEIDPLLMAQEKLRFLPQSVPFFTAHEDLRALMKQYPQYTIKEAALNPTNPADKATDWEAAIIAAFRQDPALTQYVTTRNTPAGLELSLSRPVRVDSKDCLTCHSTPAAAPTSMTDLYGTQNGFGWTLGSIQGAEIVSVPMQVAQARANRTFITFVAALAAVFAITLVLLNILLSSVIIRPIRRMAAIAGEISLGHDAPEFSVRGHDEISALGQAFNRMRRSLASALKILEG